MKKVHPVLLSASLLILFAFVTPTASLPLGSTIPKPDVKLKDVSGNEVTLNGAKTKSGLLVMFTCNTCPVVHRNQGRTKEICAYTLQKGVGVVLLNSNEGSRNDGDSYTDMKDYAVQQGFKWTYAVDKDNVLADAFGADRTPECYLFDKDSKLVYHGAIDDNPSNESAVSRHHLKEAINEMTSGKEVSVKQSRSVGCNIKRI